MTTNELREAAQRIDKLLAAYHLDPIGPYRIDLEAIRDALAALTATTAQRHGHVTPRPDGTKARCGGPAFCKVCQAERAALTAATNELREAAQRALSVLEMWRDSRGGRDWIWPQSGFESAMRETTEAHANLSAVLTDRTKAALAKVDEAGLSMCADEGQATFVRSIAGFDTAHEADLAASAPTQAGSCQASGGLVDCGECRTQGCPAGKCRNAAPPAGRTLTDAEIDGLVFDRSCKPRLAEAQARAALRELVALKALKDELAKGPSPFDLDHPDIRRGKVAEYERRRPAAWAAARAILAASSTTAGERE